MLAPEYSPGVGSPECYPWEDQVGKAELSFLHPEKCKQIMCTGSHQLVTGECTRGN